MEYAERGSLADFLRRGRLRRADTGTPNLAATVQCLQDIANGVRMCLSMQGSFGGLADAGLVQVLLQASFQLSDGRPHVQA